MQVTVKLSTALAADLRAAALPMEAVSALKRLGVTLRPMHPARSTGPLATYFVADVPDERALAVTDALRAVRGIESVQPTLAVGLPG
ncbi:MAG: hypothetical protein K2X11_01330 [Acetobacteraceae bacterium]|nr:hypothetical protein [Acetobacteraceae bacterium]